MISRIANHRAIAALIFASSLPLAPATAAGAENGAERALAGAYNMSGQDLFRTLAKQPGNIVLSPYSIGTAMAMVLAGARGETQTEMRLVLRHSLSAGEIDAANARALGLLTSSDAKSADAKPEIAATLRIANALMLVNAGATVAPSFEETIRTQYGSELFKDATLDTVNAWIKAKTEGKIEKILERLNPQDSHVLLNAVYFKAPWAHAFPSSATRDRPFTLTNGEDIHVPTMTQQGEFAIAKGDGYAVIRLPYAMNGLSMTIVRPDAADGLDTLIAGIDGAKAEAILKSVRDVQKRMVALSMPRFKFEFKAELIEPFKSFGMTKVFDPAQSDLSGLTGKPRTEAQSTIDQIAHRAVIEVAEEGTEAAAATAVVVTTRAMRPDEVERFQIDRPFLFMISDDKTGAILFQGRVSDPRS